MITAKCKVCGRRYWFNHASWQAECCAKEDKMFPDHPTDRLCLPREMRMRISEKMKKNEELKMGKQTCCICGREMMYDHGSDCYYCPKCGVNFHPTEAYDEAVKKVRK
jgi:hypothetical protein